MRHVLLGLAVFALWLPGGAWSGGGMDDSQMMEGTWRPVEAELGGQKLPDEILKALKLTIMDGKYTVNAGKQVDKGAIKLEPTAKPKAMDIIGAEGPNKGKTFPAIYELTGDTLRICYDLSGKMRPTEFKAANGPQQFLVTYQRMKN